MGVQARETVVEMEVVLEPWPIDSLTAHSAFTDLIFLSSNHCSLLWSLVGFCFHSKPWHDLLSPWDSPVFKVKANKRQLVSSRVTPGTVWGSRNAAEHGGDTRGHWSLNQRWWISSAAERKLRKHPCCWCWWLPQKTGIHPSRPCMEIGCGLPSTWPPIFSLVPILRSIYHKIQDSSL